MVVLHGQPRDARGAALRLPAHLLPLGPGAADAERPGLGLGDAAGLARPLHGERRRRRALPLLRALEPRRARARGRSRRRRSASGWRTGRRRRSSAVRSSRAAAGRAGGRGARPAAVQQGKPPVLQGDRGLSRKSAEPGNASYYYSLTRMPATGTRPRGDGDVRRGGRRLDGPRVEHQLARRGPGGLGLVRPPARGRHASSCSTSSAATDGTRRPASSGTLVAPDGASRTLDASATSPSDVLDRWQSPRSGARYPARWRLRDPLRGPGPDRHPAAGRPGARRLLPLLGGRGRVEGTHRGRPVQGRATSS